MKKTDINGDDQENEDEKMMDLGVLLEPNFAPLVDRGAFLERNFASFFEHVEGARSRRGFAQPCHTAGGCPARPPKRGNPDW